MVRCHLVAVATAVHRLLIYSRSTPSQLSGRCWLSPAIAARGRCHCPPRPPHPPHPPHPPQKMTLKDVRGGQQMKPPLSGHVPRLKRAAPLGRCVSALWIDRFERKWSSVAAFLKKEHCRVRCPLHFKHLICPIAMLIRVNSINFKLRCYVISA